MSDNRKYFNDSILPLQAGANANGLTVNDAGDGDLAKELVLSFEFNIPAETTEKLQHAVNSGQVLQHDEVISLHTPDQNELAALQSWLKSENFEIVFVSAAGNSVYARATAAQISKSLQVKMVQVVREDLSYTSALDVPSLPIEIGKNIQAIIGMQPHQRFKRKTTSVTPTGPGIHVNEVLDLYGVTGTGLTGKGQMIAVVMDGVYMDSDLTWFWTENNVTNTLGNIEKKSIYPALAYGPINDEVALDMEWASSLAPGAIVRLYSMQATNSVDIYLALDQIVADRPTSPGLNTVSMSLCAGESEYGAAIMNAGEQKCLAMAAAGINIFAASGDDGSFTDLALQPGFPASAPSIIGVGGTQLIPGVAPPEEESWTGSGGGISGNFSRPGWQRGSTITTGPKRLVPDVCALAHSCYTRVDGVDVEQVGTSWATPIWAACCALLNEAAANAGHSTLPYLNPFFYSLLGTSSFTNVEGAGNGPVDYPASAGYNMVTGIGSPNLPALITALLKPYVTTIKQTNTIFNLTTANLGQWSTVDFTGNDNNDLAFIQTSNTASGKVEVNIASGAGNYQNYLLQQPSVFTLPAANTVFLFQYDNPSSLVNPTPDLLALTTMGTASGKVSAVLAMGSSSYTTSLWNGVTGFPCSNNGVWVMTGTAAYSVGSTLAFIQTRNTTSGKVEVSFASFMSNFDTVTPAVTTAFNTSDAANGTWLMSNYFGDGPDLIFIQTQNTASGQVEILIATCASNYQTVALNTMTSFSTGNAQNGIWQITPYMNYFSPTRISFIQTSNTGSTRVTMNVSASR